jgi:hypothetical protein
LAFLGGVDRRVLSNNKYGVHRFFITGTDIATSAEANDRAQIISSRIISYLVEMGADANLYGEMSKAGAAEMNFLSERQMVALRVTTPLHKSTWELTQADRFFYLRGSTEDERGLHKFLIYCDTAPNNTRFIRMTAMAQNGNRAQEIAEMTGHLQVSSDIGDVDLRPEDILDRATPQNSYTSASFRMNRQVERILRTGTEMGFRFMPPAKQIFWGWTADLTAGRDKITTYLDNCR